jgi:hypothetical protein
MPLNYADAGTCGWRHPRQRRGKRLVGNIIKFPEEGRIVRFGRADVLDESATVIILPVIRIERHMEARADEPEPRTNPPDDNSGRRRVRRR